MVWLNLIVLAVLAAGHVEVMVTLVNRLHAHRVPCGLLRHIRHLHDLLVLGFPPALVWFVGIAGPGVLVGGSWRELPTGWAAYLGVCAAGAAGLVVSAVRWRLTALPTALVSNDSQIVDVAERLGFRPIGPGPYQMLTRVPGNEIFQVEVSDKTLRLPRLPREWDGLSILHLSDLHFIGTVDRPFYDQVIDLSRELDADLVVFTGDLLDDPRLIDWVPETLGRLDAPLGRYFVLGNHDWYLDPDEIRRRLVEIGWQDMAGRTVALERHGCPLVLGGTEVPWMGRHPDFSQAPSWPGLPASAGVPVASHAGLAGGRALNIAAPAAADAPQSSRTLAASAAEDVFRILLSHTPDNLSWARAAGVDLMLSGHNHGGQVVLPLIGPVYSPSRYGVKYCGGLFDEPPTLLCVSRGLAGRHPLRWNCRPELTRLVLRAAE